MSRKKSNRFENLLPNDEDLIKRSIIWGTIFEKHAKKGENEVEDLPFGFENLDGNKDNSNESVDPLDFERNTESDSYFDVQDTLNKTKKYVEKRIQNWHDSGLDQIMDSFNLNKIQSKVGNWLLNENNFFNNFNSKAAPLPVSFINEEVKIQNHEIYSDNDSVDTAKYILSSRKRTKSKITTMTIKRYRYSNRKRINEQEQYLKSDQRFLKDHQYKNPSDSVNESRYSNNISKHSKKKTKRKFPTNYRRNKSTDTSKSSSSTSEISEIGCKLFPEYDRKKFSLSPKNHRNITRKSSKWRNILHAKENNKSFSSSETSAPSPYKKNLRKKSINTKTQKLNKAQQIHSNMSVQSEINFNEKNFINSTAIDEPIINDKNSRKLSTVIELPEFIQKNDISNHKENKETNAKKVNSSPIVLYEPDNSKLGSNISMKKFIITKKLLTDKIGEDLAAKILNGEKKIGHEFDSSSKIIFYPPESESENSSSSQSDILEKLCKRKGRGRIVEVVDLIV